MTNLTILTGRITKDIEIKEVGSNAKVARFSLAVDNPFKKDDASFFQVEAWNKTAELVSTYCGKGSKILVEGSLKQDRFEDKEGKKRESVKVNVNRVEFLDSKKDSQEKKGNQSNSPFANANGPIDIQDDDLPF